MNDSYAMNFHAHGNEKCWKMIKYYYNILLSIDIIYIPVNGMVNVE